MTDTLENPTQDVSARKADTLESLHLADLKASPRNPRDLFDAAALEELAASIKEHGVLEPIVVRPIIEDLGRGMTRVHHHEIIAGERRYQAARMAGLSRVPCIVKDVRSDRDALVLTLVENLHRQDLNPMEAARGYQELTAMGYKQERIAQLVGGSVPLVSNTLRLLRLPDTVQAMIARGDLTRSHGLLLLPLVGIKAGSTKAEQEAPCLQMAEWCVQQHWSTKRLETQIEADYPKAKAETLPLDVPEDTQGARIAPPGPVPDPLTPGGDTMASPPRLYPDGFRFRDRSGALTVVTGPAVNNELDGSQSYAVEWLDADGKRITTGRMSEAGITARVREFEEWEKGYDAPTAVGEPDVPASDDAAPGEAVELPDTGGPTEPVADLAGDDPGQPDEPRSVPSAQAPAPGVGDAAAPGVADAVAPKVLPPAVSVAPATVTVAPDFRTAFDSLLGELRVFLAQMHQGYGKRDGNKIGRAYVCEKVKEIIAHYDEGGAKPPFIASPFAPGQPVEVERPGGWVPAKVTDAQTIHGKEVVSVAVEGEVGFAIQRADQVRPVTPAEPSTPPPVNRTAFLPPDTLAAFTDPAINASGQIGGKNGKVAHPITFEGDLWAVVSTSFLPGGGREAMACRLVPRAEWTGPINEHKQSGNTYYGMPVKTPAGDFVLSGEYVDFCASPEPAPLTAVTLAVGDYVRNTFSDKAGRIDGIQSRPWGPVAKVDYDNGSEDIVDLKHLERIDPKFDAARDCKEGAIQYGDRVCFGAIDNYEAGEGVVTNVTPEGKVWVRTEDGLSPRRFEPGQVTLAPKETAADAYTPQQIDWDREEVPV